MFNKSKTQVVNQSETNIGDIGLTGAQVVDIVDILQTAAINQIHTLNDAQTRVFGSWATMAKDANESSKAMSMQNLQTANAIAVRGVPNQSVDIANTVQSSVKWLGLGITTVSIVIFLIKKGK